MAHLLGAFPTPDWSEATQLNFWIEKGWRATGSVDPMDVARWVLGNAPRELLDAELLRLLQPACRIWQNNHKRHPDDILSAEPRSSTIRSGKWAPIIKHEPKVTQVLNDTGFYIKGEWKRLGEMTLDDVRWLAAYYRHLAATHLDKAEKLDAFEVHMVKTEANFVGQLPDAVIREVWL